MDLITPETAKGLRELYLALQAHSSSAADLDLADLEPEQKTAIDNVLRYVANDMKQPAIAHSLQETVNSQLTPAAKVQTLLKRLEGNFGIDPATGSMSTVKIED
ncbi:MAG: hypothetical protein LBE25_13555 [Arthrobacter sp.]|jgi:hypothetical protein|nr:hypothetical protein [Arthrobacter sp.]